MKCRVIILVAGNAVRFKSCQSKEKAIRYIGNQARKYANTAEYLVVAKKIPYLFIDGKLQKKSWRRLFKGPSREKP